MDVEQFEQNILELAFETDVRITTASVAYYLGVPSTKAEPMLEKLLERGVLELDSDAEGNLYYRIVDAAAPDSGKLSELKHERAVGIDGGVDVSMEKGGDGESDTPNGPHLIGDATVDGTGEDADAYSPRGSAGESVRAESVERGGPQATTGIDGPEGETTGSVGVGRAESRDESAGKVPKSSEAHLDSAVSRDSKRPSSDGRAPNGKGPSSVASRSKSEDPLAGVTRKQAATDASLDSCGEEPLVVKSEAECEPRPFADSDPVVASCSDQAAQTSTSMVSREQSSSMVGQTRGARAGAAGASQRSGSARSMVYREADQFEKPEHQPGMSLLLSLILCGTGQIYNGEVSKGIMMMVLCFLLWFVLLGWVVHIWSIVDSVVVAEQINRKSGDNSQKTGPSRQLSSG